MTTFAIVNNNNDTVANSSEDGTTWTARTDLTARWSSVIYLKSLQKFFAINGNGGSSNWQKSGDGHTWTSLTRFGAHYSAGWSNELGIGIVHLDTNHATKELAWSNDPTTNGGWTSVAADSAENVRPSGGTGGHSIAWSKELTLFCIVGNASGTRQYTTSSDGKTWTANTTAAYNGTSIAWGGDGSGGGAQLFIAVGTGNIVKRSANGTSWTAETFATSPGNTTAEIAYSPSLDRFVVVGGNGTCNTREGSGTTWTDRSGGSGLSSHTWKSVCWSTELSLFCAVAASGHIATSSDGITWTDQTPSSAGIIWASVAVSESAGVTTSIAQTLQSLQQEADISQVFVATIAQTLQTLQQEGDVGALNVIIGQTLQSLQQEVTAFESQNWGTISQILRTLQQQVTIAEIDPVAIAQTLAKIRQVAFVHIPKAPGTGGFQAWWTAGP